MSAMQSTGAAMAAKSVQEADKSSVSKTDPKSTLIPVKDSFHTDGGAFKVPASEKRIQGGPSYPPPNPLDLQFQRTSTISFRPPGAELKRMRNAKPEPPQGAFSTALSYLVAPVKVISSAVWSSTPEETAAPSKPPLMPPNIIEHKNGIVKEVASSKLSAVAKQAAASKYKYKTSNKVKIIATPRARSKSPTPVEIVKIETSPPVKSIPEKPVSMKPLSARARRLTSEPWVHPDSKSMEPTTKIVAPRDPSLQRVNQINVNTTKGSFRVTSKEKPTAAVDMTPPKLPKRMSPRLTANSLTEQLEGKGIVVAAEKLGAKGLGNGIPLPTVISRHTPPKPYLMRSSTFAGRVPLPPSLLDSEPPSVLENETPAVVQTLASFTKSDKLPEANLQQVAYKPSDQDQTSNMGTTLMKTMGLYKSSSSTAAKNSSEALIPKTLNNPDLVSNPDGNDALPPPHPVSLKQKTSSFPAPTILGAPELTSNPQFVSSSGVASPRKSSPAKTSSRGRLNKKSPTAQRKRKASPDISKLPDTTTEAKHASPAPASRDMKSRNMSPPVSKPRAQDKASSPKTYQMASPPKSNNALSRTSITAVRSSSKPAVAMSSPQAAGVKSSPQTNQSKKSPQAALTKQSPQAASVASSLQTAPVTLPPQAAPVASPPKATPVAPAPPAPLVTSPKQDAPKKTGTGDEHEISKFSAAASAFGKAASAAMATAAGKIASAKMSSPSQTPDVATAGAKAAEGESLLDKVTPLGPMSTATSPQSSTPTQKNEGHPPAETVGKVDTSDGHTDYIWSNEKQPAQGGSSNTARSDDPTTRGSSAKNTTGKKTNTILGHGIDDFADDPLLDPISATIFGEFP